MSTEAPPKARRTANKNHQMSQDELLSLPVTVSVTTAGRGFGLAPSTSQDMAKRGTFPCRVLRIGRSYRVRRIDLFRALGIEDAPEERQPLAQVG